MYIGLQNHLRRRPEFKPTNFVIFRSTFLAARQQLSIIQDLETSVGYQLKYALKNVRNDTAAIGKCLINWSASLRLYEQPITVPAILQI